MSANGFLTSDELSPIAGGGWLRHDAAAAWNAMAEEILRETGVLIRVNGPDSSYRNFARQQYWKDYWCAHGACENAATPGTSNHGLGIACDVPEHVRVLIAQYGAKYGWDRGCSDAPWESWHHKWCGGWTGQNPGPIGTAPSYPTLRKGDQGDAVRRAQKHLRRWNLGVTRPQQDGDFGPTTKTAVRQFQHIHKLESDGIIGPSTWKKLREKDPFLPDERAHFNILRIFQRGGIKPAERERADFHKEWCGKRARRIAETARRYGWQKQARGRRHKVLKNISD